MRQSHHLSVRLALILLVIMVLSNAAPALAHGYLVRALPGDGAELARSPARVQYWFSEDLEADFSRVTVRDSSGAVIAEGGVDPANAALLTARLPTQLPEGPYLAELRIAFAGDGHVIVETHAFFVGAAVDGVGGRAASGEAIPLEVLWRALLYTGLVGLFGVLTLYDGILLPAWGDPAHRAGNLPPRVMRRLFLIAAGALVLAFAANLIALIQQTMAFFSADFSRVLSEGLWQVVRSGTRFGEVWTARMLLLILVGGLLGLAWRGRTTHPENIRPFWTASTWAAALLLGTLGIASHASGSLLWPWLALLSDWAHTTAAGFWVGGLAALVLVLPAALAPLDDDLRRRAFAVVLGRFSKLAFLAALVVIASGIYSASNWVRTPGEASSPYGLALALKTALVLALLGLAALHRAALTPERWKRWSGWFGRLHTLRLETVFALAVLAAAAWLSATPPPTPEALAHIPPPLTAAQTVDGVTAAISVSPGGTGVISTDVTFTRGDTPLDDQIVFARLAAPARDWRSLWQPVDPVGDGVYLLTDASIDQAGMWWLLLETIHGADQRTRFAFPLAVSVDGGIPTALPPNILNLLALAGLVGALLAAIWNRLIRFARALDLRPQMLLIAAITVIASGALLVLGGQMLNSSQAAYDAVLNPPPTQVNDVLPDAASLVRGRALYERACVEWILHPTPLMQFSRNFDTLRDEQLLEATEGRAGMPACDPALTLAERWDIVNYLRSWVAPMTAS